MWVIISIFFCIEWANLKCIQRIMGCKFELLVNILVSKNWDKVGIVYYCIKVDNSRAVWYGIDNPYMHVFIWFISHTVIPTWWWRWCGCGCGGTTKGDSLERSSAPTHIFDLSQPWGPPTLNKAIHDIIGVSSVHIHNPVHYNWCFLTPNPLS